MAKILLVDDEPNIRWTMAEMLKREGHEALSAADFDGALSIIERERLDVVVADIILPGRSGIEILKAVNRHDPSIPVIMITGEPSVSQTREIVRAGAYDYIVKPATRDALMRAVSNAVEKKELVDERRRLQEQVRRHAERLEQMVAQRTSELAAAHNFLNAVLNSATEYAIVAIDLEGMVVLFNRGAELIFGRGGEGMKGQPVARLTAAAASPDEPELLRITRQVTGEKSHKSEMALSRADGSTFIASVAITAICEAEGKLLGHLLIARDLTLERSREDRLRQMQEQLAHNEKIAALGRMAAQVAHEVRNPLAGLQLYAMHLRGKLAEKISAGEMGLVDKMIGGINQLSDTTERVLSFARTLTLSRRRVDVNCIVTDSLALLNPQLREKEIVVQLRLAEPDAFAIVDDVSIRSTLINLTLNAIQAMGEGGRLTLSTSVSEATLRLGVTDTGCGMSDEQVSNMFEPFYTTKSQGLGLGLSFAAKVIHLHGGNISVESRLNEGTSIKIALPITAEA